MLGLDLSSMAMSPLPLSLRDPSSSIAMHWKLMERWHGSIAPKWSCLLWLTMHNVVSTQCGLCPKLQKLVKGIENVLNSPPHVLQNK